MIRMDNFILYALSPQIQLLLAATRNPGATISIRIQETLLLVQVQP
jgi:hypothetical protein